MTPEELQYEAVEAAIRDLAQEASEPEPVESGKPSIATQLVNIAQGLYRFGVTPAGETFAVPVNGPRVVLVLRGGRTSLGAQLRREYFKLNGRTAPGQAVADALATVEGFAAEMEPTELHQRVAEHNGALWLDLGDTTGRAVRITAEGWSVEPSAPILFRRTALTAALPEPVKDGTLDQLWTKLNVNEDDRPLVEAWLVSTLFPDLPHPVLGLFGEQGTGKSTAAKLLSYLTDPSPVPLRKPPKDMESWVTAAQGSWTVALDNLSWIPEWLSDSLCRAVTGDGDVRRRLYTDGDLHVFAFRRCLILNGIDIGAMRADLADRMLSITLATVPDGNRLTEEEFWAGWDKDHAVLLGALLTRVSEVREALPSVHLETKPRMADFARLLAAVDQIGGTNGMSRYLSMQDRMATDSLSADPFIAAMTERITEQWSGTSAELLHKVDGWSPTSILDGHHRGRGWPSSAKAVTAKVTRFAPMLRRAGWQVSDDGGQNHHNVVKWTLAPPSLDGGAGKPGSQPSQTRTGREEASHASQESLPSIPRARSPFPIFDRLAKGDGRPEEES